MREQEHSLSWKVTEGYSRARTVMEGCGLFPHVNRNKGDNGQLVHGLLGPTKYVNHHKALDKERWCVE